MLASAGEIAAGEDVAALVPRHRVAEPVGARLGADHHEEPVARDALDLAARPVADDDRLELLLAFAVHEIDPELARRRSVSSAAR